MLQTEIGVCTSQQAALLTQVILVDNGRKRLTQRGASYQLPWPASSTAITPAAPAMAHLLWMSSLSLNLSKFWEVAPRPACVPDLLISHAYPSRRWPFEPGTTASLLRLHRIQSCNPDSPNYPGLGPHRPSKNHLFKRKAYPGGQIRSCRGHLPNTPGCHYLRNFQSKSLLQISRQAWIVLTALKRHKGQERSGLTRRPVAGLCVCPHAGPDLRRLGPRSKSRPSHRLHHRRRHHRTRQMWVWVLAGSDWLAIPKRSCAI